MPGGGNCPCAKCEWVSKSPLTQLLSGASGGVSPAVAVEGVQCGAALSPRDINPGLISVCLSHISTSQKGHIQLPGCSQDYRALSLHQCALGV